MKMLRFIITGLLYCAPLAAANATQPVDDVDVFMGTSNSRWMLFPGATLPFGLVKFSPDNQDNVWNGGYEYTIGSISGFSHLHAMSLSGVSLMPVVGQMESKLFPARPMVRLTACGPAATGHGFARRTRRPARAITAWNCWIIMSRRS